MFAGTIGVSLHWNGSLLGPHPGESPTENGAKRQGNKGIPDNTVRAPRLRLAGSSAIL